MQMTAKYAILRVIGVPVIIMLFTGM